MTTADRILVIDDDKVVCHLVSASAEAMGLHCVTTREPATVLELVTPETTLILLDLMMPDMDGIEVLRLLGEQRCKARIVLMSGMNKRVIETAEKLAHTLGLSVVGHLQKPFPLAELKLVLGANLAPEKLEASAETAQSTFSDEDLLLAFERKEFLLHYQPQISLATGDVTGLEALSRWQHPELGMILPDDFIARVEALGLMDRLCWITVERGMTDLRQFSSPDGKLPRLSINATVRTLRDLKFPDTLVSMAGKHNIPRREDRCRNHRDRAHQ